MPVCLFEQSFDNTAEHLYIHVGPMGARAVAAVVLGKLLIRVALSRILVEEPRQRQRIKEQEIWWNWNANALRHITEHCAVKGQAIVGNDRKTVHPSEELRERFLLAGGVRHILVADCGEFGDEGRDSGSRLDESLPGLYLPAILVAGQGNLDHLGLLACSLSAKGFEVEDYQPTAFERLSSRGWPWVFRLYFLYPHSEAPMTSRIHLKPFGITNEEPLKTLARDGTPKGTCYLALEHLEQDALPGHAKGLLQNLEDAILRAHASLLP